MLQVLDPDFLKHFIWANVKSLDFSRRQALCTLRSFRIVSHLILRKR